MSAAVKSLFGFGCDRLAGPAAQYRRPSMRGVGASRLAFVAAAALLLAAIAPPVAFVAVPSMLTLFEPPLAVDVVVGLLLLMPGLTGLAAARIGLRRIVHTFRARPDSDHAIAAWRIFGGLFLFGYGFALALPRESGTAYPFAVAAVGLVVAWVLLLLTLTHPRSARFRRYCGIATDAALLSAFLHFGGGPAAASFSLYLLLILSSGWRFGFGALTAAAGLSILGFVAVVATTAFWRELPGLAAGSVAILIIVAVGAGAMLRAIAAAQQSGADTAVTRSRLLAAAGDALRQALAAAPTESTGTTAQELRAQLQDVEDLLSVAAGTVTVASEPFDLHALANQTLRALRRNADRQGVRLGVRIDPAVPFQLRGPSRQLGRILHNLVAIALGRGEHGPLRLSIDALAAGGRGLRLRLCLRGGATPPQRDAPGFAVVEQLVELVGGEIEAGESESGGWHISVALPMAFDPASPGVLDLADRPVLIVSDDSQFAGELAEPLNGWRADVRWIGGYEAALDHLPRFDVGLRPVLIVDARLEPLPALSFVHRTATAPAGAPFILLIAAPDQADRIAELADGAFDNVLAAPVAAALLGNALHALPLSDPMLPRFPTDEVEAPVDSAPRPVSAEARITPITAHPRFVSDPTEILDVEAVAALRSLDDGDFLGELIEGFRDEARSIIERAGRAAAQPDLVGFCDALTALRRCAGNVGGFRLGDLARTMRNVSEDELRDQGGDYMHRLAAELARLDTALIELLGAPQARRQ